MFQAHLSTFDMGAEDQLAWDQIRYDDILAIMEGAPQQADDLAVSQLTQPPRVLSQPSHLAAVQSDHGRWSDIGGRWSDTGRQSDTDRQSDTGCCRLVASGHGDTFSRPARTASHQGTGPWAAARSDHDRRSDTGGGGATPDAAGSSQAAMAHEQNVVTEHRLHDTATWVAYLQWYLPRTWTRVTYVPATTTATCPGPRQGPAERDLHGALRSDRRHSDKLRYCKHITFI
jgi:hypothetical protein